MLTDFNFLAISKSKAQEKTNLLTVKVMEKNKKKKHYSEVHQPEVQHAYPYGKLMDIFADKARGPQLEGLSYLRAERRVGHEQDAGSMVIGRTKLHQSLGGCWKELSG